MIKPETTPIGSIDAAQSAAMSDHLVRVGHLKAIQKVNEWTDAELARQCGKSQQQVRSWFTGSRNIGERLARELEERLGLVRYALDDRYGKSSIKEPSNRGVASDSGLGVTKRVREMPVIPWAQLATMLALDNASLKQKAPHLDTFAVASGHAKFLQMNDDSMAEEFQPGDHVLFDPTESPRAGDVVLVRLPSNEHFIRIFRPRTAYVFEALPLNSHYQALSSKDDGALVVAVMVEHRRYRRPA